MATTKLTLQEILQQLLLQDNLIDIRKKVQQLKNNSSQYNSAISLEDTYLQKELEQVLATQTLERTKYYIKRLLKAITVVKTSKINDLNLNQWKQYDDLLTDSLWIIDKRANSGQHNAGYWGNFVPQIPNQFIRRFTKQGDWVLDPFLGSGTTLLETKRLGRNAIGIELSKEVLNTTIKTLHKEDNPYQVITQTFLGDCLAIDYEMILQQNEIKKLQLVILHPPYWDIIKFSEKSNDFSNAKTLNDFLAKMKMLIDKTYSILEKGRYCVLVISDKYENGEWLPLAFYTMQEVLKKGYILKSTIVKNFDNTKGKQSQQELWRYRALVGGFHIFKHEYIFLFQKK